MVIFLFFYIIYMFLFGCNIVVFLGNMVFALDPCPAVVLYRGCGVYLTSLQENVIFKCYLK